MAVKNHLNGAKFLMFQDDPGEGMQAYIFKRFYLWEEECTRRIEQVFGAKLIYRSWKEVNARAEQIDSVRALAEFRSWELPSHHQMIITGRQKAGIIQIARVFGWACEVIE